LELADWLAVNRKTIRRWMSGEDEPRAVMWTELLEITQERHAQLAELIKAIAERAEKA
jgi:predicted DNA-binding ribbon-helix-helix protein